MQHKTFPKPTKKKRRQKVWDGDPLLEPWAVGKKLGMVTPDINEEVENRSGGRCEICGLPATERHHLAWRKRRAWAGNLLHLCEKCHKPPLGIHGNSFLYEQEMRKLQDSYYLMGYEEGDVRYLLGTKDGRLF